MSRTSLFDNLAIGLSALVFWGHLEGNASIWWRLLPSWLYVWIFLFHMPAFGLLSGRLAALSRTGIGERILTRIAPPFFFFTLLNPLFTHSRPSLLTEVGMLWFLLSFSTWLIVAEPFLAFGRRVGLTGRRPIYLAFALAILAGFYSEIGLFFTLSRTVVLFPFFLLGYTARIEEWKATPLRRIGAFAILGLAAWAAHVVTTRPDLLFHREWLYHRGDYASVLQVVFRYDVARDDPRWWAVGALMRSVVLGIALAMTWASVVLAPRRTIRLGRFNLSSAGSRKWYPYLLQILFLFQILPLAHGWIGYVASWLVVLYGPVPGKVLTQALLVLFFTALTLHPWTEKLFWPLVDPFRRRVSKSP